MTSQTNLKCTDAPLTDLQPMIDRYKSEMQRILEAFDWAPVHALAKELLDCWKTGRQVFVCGNGGSGANANHIANDFIYGISKTAGSGLKCHSLSANSSITSCLGNDIGYDNIFAYQLSILANPGDVLIVLSGSGNSPNVVKALEESKKKGVHSYAILGYSGGQSKNMAGTAIHFAIDDMQISEDLQMMVAHIISQWLYANKDCVSG